MVINLQRLDELQTEVVFEAKKIIDAEAEVRKARGIQQASIKKLLPQSGGTGRSFTATKGTL